MLTLDLNTYLIKHNVCTYIRFNNIALINSLGTRLIMIPKIIYKSFDVTDLNGGHSVIH